MSVGKSPAETATVISPTPVVEALGEWCIRKGLATAEEIDSCLKIQRASQVAGKSPPRLGEILVARGILTPHQVAEALAAQKKEIRTCPRCGIQINVATRGDADGYRCGRCNGPLKPPTGRPPLDAVDEEFILVSKDPVPPEVNEALRSPEARFGKYVLLRKLGQGGIGIVYLAWDTYLSQYVALKRLRTARPLSPQDTPNEHVQSLLKEARNCIRLRHPGVVSVFDVGRVGREYYVAMEYLEGETLAEKFQAARQAGAPSPYYVDAGTTLSQLVEIARAIQYAHSRPSPIVHCDLKPANILIDRDRHAHVLDFGLARNLELDKPEQGEISGTPSYMAPEQASGESHKIDRRTDVYAFGAVLYELLTGRPPFVGGAIEVLGQTIGDEPDRPSDTVRATQMKAKAAGVARELPPIPRALEELCLRCLRKNQSERPQSMDEVAAALEAGAASPAPEASTPTLLPGRPGRSRPSRMVAVLITLSAAILAVGSALVHFSLPAPAAPGSFDARESEVVRAITTFHPRHAQALASRLRIESKGDAREARATWLEEEATWVSRLLNRAAERLAVRPVDCPAHCLRRGAAAGGRLLGADAAGVRVSRDGREEQVAWESLGPVELIDVLRAILQDPDDADLLALGILAHRNGLAVDAVGFFSRLRTTSLAPIAERYRISQD